MYTTIFENIYCCIRQGTEIHSTHSFWFIYRKLWVPYEPFSLVWLEVIAAFFLTFRVFSDRTKCLGWVLSDVSKGCGDFTIKRRQDIGTMIIRNVGRHPITLRNTWRHEFSKPFNLLKHVLQWNTVRIDSQQRPHRTPRAYLTHCGRVTQICVFNTVKLGTYASSP
jgi:hypothetical protein